MEPLIAKLPLDNNQIEHNLQGYMAVLIRELEAHIRNLSLRDSEFKAGNFSRVLNAADGNISYTGIGFQPSGIIVIGTIALTEYLSIGFTTGTDMGCICRYATALTFGPSPLVVMFHSGSAGEKATFSSFDTDGFTLTWSVEGAGINNTGVCYYLAFR